MASAPFLRASSRVNPSLRSMCRSETGMTTWICGDCASLMARQTASISSRSARASAVTAKLRISRAMRLHASNSPAEELGNPASMTSTPSFSSCLAMRSFEVAFRWKPGDGEQSPGFHLNATSKLRIARQLEKLGVDVIEAGFPSSSAGEFDACRRIAREIRSVAVPALARADRDEIDAVWRAIRDAQSPQIHVVMPVSDLHIERKLGLTREEALKKGAEAIAYARSLCENVQYSAEDAGRADLDYVIESVETMIALGANVINIADSTGYCVPSEFGEIVEQVIGRARGADRVLFSVHCHNDLGLATANAKAGVM